MSEFVRLYERREDVHRLLYGVHHDLYRGALKKIADALLILHDVECRSSGDERQAAQVHIARLQGLRMQLEGIGSLPMKILSEFTNETGCSGECADKPTP